MSQDDLSGDDREAIVSDILRGHKIQAIKRYRESTGCGLKEAKEFIDGLTEELAKTHPELKSQKAGCGSAVLLLLVGVGALPFFS